MSQVEVTLKNSLIGCTQKQKSAVLCLGLKKPGQKVTLKLNPSVQGQLNKVKHLLFVKIIEAKKVAVQAKPAVKKVEKKVAVQTKPAVKKVEKKVAVQTKPAVRRKMKGKTK